MNKKISVVIHTYNNENIISECLESVKDFDEIVLCDMYSTDKTVEIAKNYGAKIVYHEKLGYVEPARNFAIQQASNEWVLVVDSDEIIPDELRNYLYKFINSNKSTNALKIPRTNYCWGKKMQMLSPDYIIRFFKKDCINWAPYVHVTPEIKDNKIEILKLKSEKLSIIHKQNWSVGNLLNAINKYSDLEVEKMIKNKKKFRPIYGTYKSLWIIIEKFILKGGYKDGIRGLIVSVLFYGVYNFCAIFKYWEYMEKQKSGTNE